MIYLLFNFFIKKNFPLILHTKDLPLHFSLPPTSPSQSTPNSSPQEGKASHEEAHPEEASPSLSPSRLWEVSHHRQWDPKSPLRHQRWILIPPPQPLTQLSWAPTSLVWSSLQVSPLWSWYTCSWNPSFLFLTALLELSLVPGCGSVHLFPSVTGKKLCDDS